SNQRMAVPKTAALPLGYAPPGCAFSFIAWIQGQDFRGMRQRSGIDLGKPGRQGSTMRQNQPYIRKPRARLVTLFAACSLLAPFNPVLAQTQAEIDDALAQLSEILGALSHLEALCNEERQATAEETISREDMERMLSSDDIDPVRQSVLIDSYNRGFRNVAITHRQCTSASTRLVDLHHASGARIVDNLLGTGGNLLADESDDETVETVPGTESTETPGPSQN
ncbi:MAG: TIGR02301 family protein, partial [Pseudomonadota bacterium]